MPSSCAAVLCGLMLSWSALAAGQEASPLPPARAPLSAPALGPACCPVPPRVERDERVWFRGALAAGYLVPPLGVAMFALTADKGVRAGMVGLLGISVPPLVHVAFGDGSGAWYALLGMATSVAAGAFLGYALGKLAPGNSQPERDAAVVGMAGYTVWAVIDITFFAYRIER